MKIVIAGNGKVGGALTGQLVAEGHDLILIDSDSEALESGMEQYDIMSVQGNCASMETLRQAGIEDADLLIATTGSDEVNLLACMTAHALNRGLHTIARIRNPEYTDQAYMMKEHFALSMDFNPDRQTAIEIDRLLKYPGFLKRDAFADGRVEIVELRVDEKSKLCGTTLIRMIGIVKCKVLVCAVLRAGNVIIPDGNFELAAGDRLFITASADNLALLLQNLGMQPHKVRRVVLIGGSMISIYLAEMLLKEEIAVQIIEEDGAKCVRLASRLPRAQIIHADATVQPVLESERVGEADAVIALTGKDELNIILSLYASSCKVDQVITKLSRVDRMQLIENLPIGRIVCPKNLCSNGIVRYVRSIPNQQTAAKTIHTIADGKVEALEFAVDENTLHCDEPLKDIRLRKNMLIVGISHGKRTEIPGGTSCFSVGDSVVVVSSGERMIGCLNDIFE